MMICDFYYANDSHQSWIAIFGGLRGGMAFYFAPVDRSCLGLRYTIIEEMLMHSQIQMKSQILYDVWRLI